MSDETEQICNPWVAKCDKDGFKYDKLIQQFGCEPITDELLTRFEKVTGKPVHVWLRRGIFFAHRQLSEILDDYEKGKPIYLYTGRGPTSKALHLGHMVPLYFTKWLQDVFDAYLVIQIADDEKYYFKDVSFDEVYKLGFENAKDIIACGFNPEKTFIFSNRDYISNNDMKNLVHDMYKHVNVNRLKAIFGFDDTNINMGQLVWPIYQSAAAFSKAFAGIFGDQNIRCLVSYAIDQDPYFRLCRDIAPKLDLYKPCSIMSTFLPSLDGSGKMSSSLENAQNFSIFMTDDDEMIKNKVLKYAFSGGRDTLKEHRQYGGNINTDIAYQYLKYFEEDDKILENIANEYTSGKMTSKEIKNIMINKIINVVNSHKEARGKVTNDILNDFYKYKN